LARRAVGRTEQSDVRHPRLAEVAASAFRLRLTANYAGFAALAPIFVSPTLVSAVFEIKYIQK